MSKPKTMSATQKRERLDGIATQEKVTLGVRCYYARALSDHERLVSEAQAKVDIAVTELEKVHSDHAKAPQAIKECDAALTKASEARTRIAIDPKLAKYAELKAKLAKMALELGQD